MSAKANINSLGSAAAEALDWVPDVVHTPLVEKIRDIAGQKGTGKWTGVSALELDVPVTLIVESVFARMISANRKQRMILHKKYPHSKCSTVKNSKNVNNENL